MARGTFSRRAWLAVAGGTLVAAGTAAVVWRPGWRAVGRPSAHGSSAAPYVDHAGWMLTPADGKKLAETSLAAVESP